MKQFKPMLAATLTSLDKVKFPVLVSPKLDGIRCVVRNGQVLSRTLKPIPNKFIREQILREAGKFQLDGEIMVEGGFNSVQSAVMREEGEPNFRYFVFDHTGEGTAYERLSAIQAVYKTKLFNTVGEADKKPDRILFLQHNLARTIEEIVRYEQECINQGYEGLMLRNPEGKYKFGRSTENEGYLVKMKRFKDAEARIIGFEQKMHNANEATKDELGRTKRSSAKDGLVPMEMLGALIVKDEETGQEFKIGTGYDDETRKRIWENQKSYLNGYVTYKYQELTEYGVPRFPVFMHTRILF